MNIPNGRLLTIFQGIDAKQNGTYRVWVVDVVTDVDSNRESIKPIHVPSISQFHNLAFEAEGIRVWKAYGIGKGNTGYSSLLEDVVTLLSREEAWRGEIFK